MMVDTHCHLGKDDYSDVSLIIQNMGNNIMIASGVDDATNMEVLDLVQCHSNVYGVMGIHPSEVLGASVESLNLIEKQLLNPKIVGVGEIGLDYHYPDVDKELQKDYFKKQILLAKKYGKTIVIHSRDAMEDTYRILEEMDLKDHKIVFHCYSGSVEMAKKLLRFPVMFGIGGVVTFKNGVKLKEVVKEIPLERLLLETDSPYLAPVPYRGQQNEPKNVLLVAEEIAKIKGKTVEEVLEQTTCNAFAQFDFKVEL